MLLNIFVLVGLLIVGWTDQSTADDSSILEIDKLRSRLLKGYDKNRRPVKDHKHVVKPELVLHVRHFTVDDVSDTMTMRCYLRMEWKDEYLGWNHTENGIDELNIDGEKIWQPQLDLLTPDITHTSNEEIPLRSCLVSDSGKVTCLVSIKYVALCAPDPRRWPHDIQNCTLKLSSGLYAGEKLDLELYNHEPYNQISVWVRNREWNVRSTSAWKESPAVAEQNVTFPSLHFSFLLERKSATHEAIVIIPAICMASLNIAYGLLTPGSTRVGLAIGLVFAHSTSFMHLSYMVPSHGDYPAYIIMFFRDSLLLTSLNVLVTLVIMTLAKLTRPPPRLVCAVNDLAKTGHSKFLTFWSPNSRNQDTIILAEDDDNSVDTEVELEPDRGPKRELQLSNLQQWQKFAVTFDNLYFSITTFTYVIIISIYVLY